MCEARVPVLQKPNLLVKLEIMHKTEKVSLRFCMDKITLSYDQCYHLF